MLAELLRSERCRSDSKGQRNEFIDYVFPCIIDFLSFLFRLCLFCNTIHVHYLIFKFGSPPKDACKSDRSRQELCKQLLPLRSGSIPKR